MISNPEGTIALSSVGHRDHDNVWMYEAATGRAQVIPLRSGAHLVSLHTSGSSYFAALQEFENEHQVEVTVRGFDAPAKVIASAWLGPEGSKLEGDRSVWQKVPTLYVASLQFGEWQDFVLLGVSVGTGRMVAQKLEWYDSRYNKEYQSVLHVLELPGDNSALISVQRSSRVILHDRETGRARAAIELAGRGEASQLRLGSLDGEIWVKDYDTIVVLERGSWRILRSARLQEGGDGKVARFVGDFALAPDKKLCLVARPISGDVIAIDEATLQIRGRATTGRQPIEVVMLQGGEIVARDWKTGELLLGRMEDC